jgi:hypothetical protein
MFFARRTRQRIRIAAIACIAYAVLVAVAAAIYPRDERIFASSFGWWLVAFPVVLFAYAAIELICTWGLCQSFWQRLSTWARVLLLVALISFFAVGAVFVSQHIGGFMAH